MRILLIIFLLGVAVRGGHGRLDGICHNTICDCFSDFGDVEYQCPNNHANEKLVIHEEGKEKLSVECSNINSYDLPLPNITFSPTEVTISQCPVTLHAAILFNINEVSKLKLENTIIEKSFSWGFFNLPLPQLTKLSLKSVTFEEDIYARSIIAPNLTSIQLEEVDMSFGSKLFANHHQLMELILNFNNILYLEDGTFENLRNLRTLLLSMNQIVILGDDLFQNLYNLQDLQLDFNMIEELNEQTFRDLRNLDNLDLSNNNLGKIERSVFQALLSIRYINLDHNRNIKLDESVFSNLSSLRIISLGNCDLRDLPEDIFTGSVNLTHIMLGYNYITHIPDRLFDGLVNLITVSLNNNDIKKLDGKMFRNLEQLKKLDLNYNQITRIDEDVFSSLTSLEEVNLRYNQLSHIDNNSFKNNIQLERIYLSNNKYVYRIEQGHFLSVSPFSRCLNLKELDLSFNLVEDILEDLFVFARFLKNLNLKNNRIQFVDVGSLWRIAKKGIILNLEENNISTFSLDFSQLITMETINKEVENEDMEGGESQISISHNPITCDCFSESFLELLTSQLSPEKNRGIIFQYKELICNNPSRLYGVNFIEVSPKDLTCPLFEILEVPFCTTSRKCECFWRPYDKTLIVDCIKRNLTAVPHLVLPFNLKYNQTEVHLESNFLKSSPNNELGYDNVTRLYLSNNQIDSISWIPPKLEVIDLTKNNLRHLKQQTLELLNHSMVTNISLGQNPWRCGCKIYNMTMFLRNNIKKTDTEDIRCQWTNKPVIHLSLEEICDNHVVFLMIFVATVLFSLLMITIMLALYYKYQKEVKIWMYSNQFCLHFFAEDDLDEDRIYDVFISYSSKDEEFVEKKLLPTLETRYKVCLHRREWIVGEQIKDNIIRSVTNSKRTLVVLTPNFLESDWGKWEFNLAYNEAIREKRNRIILLVKEEIDITSLDGEIKSYVSTITYLNWNDAWFWKRLAYALPHKRIDNC